MRKAMYSAKLFDKTVLLDDNTITEVSELNPFYGLKLKDRVQTFRQVGDLINKYYEFADITDDPYIYYHQFWSLSKWNYIFQKEVENMISKFSWKYGFWIYIRIKLTLIHGSSKEKNISDYVYDYLQTLPKQNPHDLANQIEKLIGEGKLELNEDQKKSLRNLIFIKEQLFKTTEEMASFTKGQFKK